ncbi:beta strand repeat-containing protein [Vogesella indigofera]|uniref:beta strand repeat-containing protein n=1 Tax=Vogesella indigofera TaxID=45465 RepID=UPI00234C6605|nr:DUF4214 domain-containing protein [Vogesella indigofera]MDC7702734.1 DUF4214 domain-containing protein [Vogesella indigofera]
MAASAYFDAVQKLYVAYYGRPADTVGLNFWAEKIDAAGGKIEDVVDAFGTSAEAQTIYGNVSIVTQVNNVFNNILGRDADVTGLNFYANKVANGEYSLASLAQRILDGATTGDDAQVVANKLAAAKAFTAAIDTAAEVLAYTGDTAASQARDFLATVTADAATVPDATAAQTAVSGLTGADQNPGQTYTLTKGVDAFTGGNGNDTFVANYDAQATAAHTLGALDVLKGGSGTDTLQITSDEAAAFTLAAASVSGIENITIRGADDVTADVSGATFSDVATLSVTKSAAASLTAGAATDVSVSGASGAVAVDGGKNVTVSDATANTNITIGATTVNAGTVTVTDTVQGSGIIAIDGGNGVTVAATNAAAAGGAITVGNGPAATDLAKGVVSVTSNHKATAATDVAMGNITVKGGSTITVTQTADTSKAATDTTGATLTQGSVTVVGGNGTTSVTVAQAKSTGEVVGQTAVAGTTETASVKFSALTATQTLILGGLTFTAAVDMTAAEAAAAFSNLVNGTLPAAGDSQSAASAAKGTYTGIFTGWTSGAVSGDTVVFTSTTANTDVANLANTGTGTATATPTAGAAATAAVTGVLGVATGAVAIDDAATAAITTVSVDGYGSASTIGNTATLSKLTDLSLANSGSTGTAGETDATMTVDAAGVASLNLTVNAIKGAVSLDGAADSALKTLNLKTTGADSSFALTAAAVETLAISGDKSANLSTGTFTALKTITVSGTAGATFDGDEADTLTSVNTSATTGKVTATIDGSKATYTGGAGVDVVTLSTTAALTKAIDLGAGDDTLVFGAAVSGSTATLSGGAGTDTLSMTVARADALDATTQTFYTNFERLLLNDVAGDDDNTADTVTIDLEKLGFVNHVTTTGTLLDTTTAANSDTLVLDNLANNGTVVIAAAAAGANTKHTVNIKDATTGTADVLNAEITSATTDVNFGTLTAAKVETINLKVSDSQLDNNADGVNDAVQSQTLVLTAADATAVNLTGNANLSLTLTGSTKVTSIDGSALTGKLTVTSLNTTSATTIKGGSANDVLTAATGTTADVLIGGAGDDTLTANAGLSTLTGGEGSDLFVVGVASLNSSSYSTITDFAAGDLLQLTGAGAFKNTKITQGDTAVFQDYANAAINSLGANEAAWFQYAGNTYIVMDAGADTATFTNSQDFVVKLTGLVDLTNASFNNTHDTIAL